MPCLVSNAVILEELFCLPLAELRKRRYLLEPGAKGVLEWRERGKVVAAVVVATLLNSEGGRLEISYKINGEPTKDIIDLEVRPSNLKGNSGRIWYFICPVTGKRCRKLYLSGGSWVSRKGISRPVLYRCQTESAKQRSWHPCPEDWPTTRPKYYAGEITRGYARHLEQEEKYLTGFYRVVGIM